MAVEIPEKLKSKLDGERESGLAGAVEKSLAAFEHCPDAKMPFFPDFTDHSSKHLTRVLELAELLIPDGTGEADNAWEVFTAQDAACLILAVLLHDAAMHLTPLSFLAIIRNNALPIPIAPS